MKLTFRTIKGTTFHVEAESTTTVGELKAGVESSQGAQFPKDSMKLVYKGKVLEDEAKPISEYGVDESGFLVVFIQKKAEPKPAAAGTAGASASTPAAAPTAPAPEVCLMRAMTALISTLHKSETFPACRMLLYGIRRRSLLARPCMLWQHSATYSSKLPLHVPTTPAGTACKCCRQPQSGKHTATQQCVEHLLQAPTSMQVDTPAPAAAAAPTATPAAQPAPDATGAEPSDPYSAAASHLLSGSALEQAVNSICEMGFPKEDVMRAMRAAYNNPERAVEYLMTGIPENVAPRVPPPQQAPAAGAAGGAPAAAAGDAAAPAAGGAAAAGPAGPPAPQAFDMFGGGGGGGSAAAAGGAAGGEAAAGGGPLDFLRGNPQFQLLRRAVQANPDILAPMLQVGLLMQDLACGFIVTGSRLMGACVA